MAEEQSVVVVGSLNVDLTMRAERFPRAGETLKAQDFAMSSGGKGANQAVAAARLGYRTRMVGCLGDDAFSVGVRADLARANVDLAGVRAVPGNTGAALITTVPGGENTIVIAAGANAAMTRAALNAAWEEVRGAGMVLTQLEIPLDTVEALAERCRAEGLPLMLDPAPAGPLPGSLLKGLAWLTPNESEAAALAGAAIAEAEEAELRRVAESFLDQGVGGVVLKLGARGAYVATAGERGMIAPFQVEAMDTTAAGDCFNGAFAVALLRGAPALEAARFACAAAALSTTRRGALGSMPDTAEVEVLLRGA